MKPADGGHGVKWRRVAGFILLYGHGVLLAPTPALAQLSLHDALERADRAAFANRIGQAQADRHATDATAALRGILPTVRVEAGFVRTTDPIGAFGTTLRQRTITQADFDPARLNYPSATNNYAGSLIVEQPLFNADAHLGRRSARRAWESADAEVEWTRISTRVDVIRAYWGAVLAAERVGTMEAGHAAARAHVEQADVLVRAGLATRSDALLAEVKAADVEVQLIEARDLAALAKRQLAVLLALPQDEPLEVPASLPSVESIRSLLESVAGAGLSERADVASVNLGRAAAKADAQRATSLHVPRLNAFARYDWNSPNGLYAGDENWTVGLMASWTVFGGASTLAERRAATARLDMATAAAEATVARAELEVEQSESARRVALVRLDIARRSVAQSAEAHRIVGRKYAGGLATVIELLDAAAVETQARLSLAAAKHGGLAGAAERLRAVGRDPAEIADLMKPELVGMKR
jgi:outer membrane protein TolC